MFQRGGIPNPGYAGRAWIVAGLEEALYVCISDRVDKALVDSAAPAAASSRGVDRRLMPALGTPLAPGPLVRSRPVLRRIAKP
jgi:hypothetical protein